MGVRCSGWVKARRNGEGGITTKISERRDEAVKLRETGLTYAEIGRKFGICRERVRQILKGKPTPQKPDLAYAEIGRRFGISRKRVKQILKGKLTPQKPDLDSKVMFGTSDVAQFLGLHPNTVRRWDNKGILKSYRISPRGDRRFRREDVDSFLKEGAERSHRNSSPCITRAQE